MTAPGAPGSSRQLAPFAALSASYFAHIGFFNPYLPLWLKDMGLSLVAISVLTSVQSATRLFAPYAWGWLSDHTGERVRLLRYSATVALLAALGLAWPGGVVWIGLVLLVMFTHTSSMMPMSEAAMAHLVSQGGRFDAGRYGRVRLWGSLGFLLTVMVAGAWFEHFGMAHFPGWTWATLFAVLVSVWCLPDHRDGSVLHEASTSIGGLLRQAHVTWLFASVFFHVLSHIAVYVFFSLYLDALGYSKTVIGGLWAVSVLVEIAWFFTQGHWLPRWPLTGWLMLCAAAMVLRMGLTAAWASVLGVLLVAQALHALTFAAHHAAVMALLSRHFPGRLRGRGQALYTVLGYGFPGVLGGLAGGALSSRWGLSSLYGLSAVVGALALFCAWRAHVAHRQLTLSDEA